jgi:hypothetical protein
MLIICFVVVLVSASFLVSFPWCCTIRTPKGKKRTYLVCSDFSRCQGEKKSCDVVRSNKEYFILGGVEEKNGRRGEAVEGGELTVSTSQHPTSLLSGR